MKVGFFDTPAWGRIGMIIEEVSGDFIYEGGVGPDLQIYLTDTHSRFLLVCLCDGIDIIAPSHFDII